MQKQSHVHNWRDIPLGTMTETVYACNGAMEDWAYGAAWDTDTNGRHKT